MFFEGREVFRGGLSMKAVARRYGEHIGDGVRRFNLNGVTGDAKIIAIKAVVISQYQIFHGVMMQAKAKRDFQARTGQPFDIVCVGIGEKHPVERR